MIKIANTQACFVELWLRLEHTRRLLWTQHKRFCVRRILKTWFGLRATDDFIWEVCQLATLDELEPLCGWDTLPPPALYPRQHRELLRAIVAVRLNISFYRIDLHALDNAYSVAFPKSTPINISKKKPPVVPQGGRREEPPYNPPRGIV